MVDEGLGEMRASKSACDTHKTVFTWIAIAPMIIGLFFIVLGLTQVYIGGTFSFVWDFATWSSWSVLLYWIVGGFLTFIGIYILMKKRQCD